jgi:hypothetical protein
MDAEAHDTHRCGATSGDWLIPSTRRCDEKTAVLYFIDRFSKLFIQRLNCLTGKPAIK